MAIREFKLPDIGEGIAEGEIVSWKVAVGQSVKEEHEFVEVMTDKATVMITVPYDGTIKELKAGEGDVVPVESVIAVIDTAGSSGSAAPADESKAEESKADAAPAASTSNGSGADQPAAPAPASAGGNGTSFEQAEPGKVLAAPATRKRAREMGIDLHQVQGTGPSGRITNEDLQAFADDGGAMDAPATSGGKGAPAMAPAAGGPAFAPISIAPPPQPGAVEERVPFRGLRRKIAEAMTRSKHTATHFTYVDDIEVTKLVTLRKEAKETYKEQGVNITYLPFIMKAVVEAMKQYPQMNSALDESTGELVIKKYYNFGVATDTDQGLIVPVIKDVDRKSIAQLAKEIQELATSHA
jgi:pyruvate dehydrogenase E2 component (dihydrolipoamide acetyltransferase)